MKKIISLLLCLCILAACIPAVSAYSNVSDWAKESVDAMYELGFLPESLSKANMRGTITRAQMCKMAVLVFEHLQGGYAYPDSTKHFTDTTDSDICYAYEQGIISGYGDGTFRPLNNVNREEFLKMAMLAFDIKISDNAVCDFADVSESEWYYKYISSAVGCGIISGIAIEQTVRHDLHVIVRFFEIIFFVIIEHETQTREIGFRQITGEISRKIHADKQRKKQNNG